MVNVGIIDESEYSRSKFVETVEELGHEASVIKVSEMEFEISNNIGTKVPNNIDVLINWKITIDRLEDFSIMSCLGIIETQVPVLNSFRSVFNATSKSLCTSLLVADDVPTVNTQYSPSGDFSNVIDNRKVYKPNMDNGGSGVRITDDLPSDGGLIQPFINTEANQQYDYRVAVIGDESPVSYKRIAPEDDFRTNSSVGGRSEYSTAPQEAKEVAVSATKAVGLDVAGVDVMRGKDGEWKVIEVNAPFYIKGCVSVTGYEIYRDVVEEAISMVDDSS